MDPLQGAEKADEGYYEAIWPRIDTFVALPWPADLQNVAKYQDGHWAALSVQFRTAMSARYCTHCTIANSSCQSRHTLCVVSGGNSKCYLLWHVDEYLNIIDK